MCMARVKTEPVKTQALLPDLSRLYGVRPLVLHWKPSGGLWPDNGAEAAGPALVTLLRDLARRPRPNKPIVLLAQSLGNASIQHLGESVRSRTFDLPNDLLKTLVLSAAAVEAEGHQLWLAPLAARAHTYVVANRNDELLTVADRLRLRIPLGRRLDDAQVALDDHVTYVDLSSIGRSFHRYYLPDSRNVPPNVKAFYDRILRGLEPDLTAFPLVRNRIRQLS